MKSQNDEYILVGKVGKPIGLKGWAKINSYTRPEENIGNYESFFQGSKKKPISIESSKKSGKNLIIKFKSIDTREDIEILKNNDLFIKAIDLPELKDNEFYWKDLIGMEVYNLKEEYFGKVKELIEAGSGDVMVIKEDRDKSILIPFEYGDYVKEVKDNKIFVDWDRDD